MKNMDALLFLENALKSVGGDKCSTECLKADDCLHVETWTDNHKKTCLECGQILEENYIANYTNSIVMTKRRKTESSIQNDIPFYIDQNIKDSAIEIYRKATENKVFRNTSKKSILLASLHRASALAGNHISYYDLLDMFSLKQHEANKGFAILSSCISKKSEHALRFDQTKEETIGINSKLKKLGMDDDEMFIKVVNVFNLVKEKSAIVNTSQPNSIICGCIYFWTIYGNESNRREDFAKVVGISKMTLTKVYVAICDVVFKSVMKPFFATLLKNCKPKISSQPKYKTILKKLRPALYGPDERIVIHDPFDESAIRVVPYNVQKQTEEGSEFPLDEVDNTMEWNILLSKQYYGDNSEVYMMHVNLVKKNDKEMYFEFKDYDKLNGVKGLQLLRELLANKFASE
jgi:transcription initiation factor TFIIIB Brf1 subunit/transcription initiation factor TFIIB